MKKFWSQHSSWQEAEKVWNDGAQKAEKENPLKVLKMLPQMPGITEKTARHLKWKSLKWMIAKDHNWAVARHILKKPLSYFFRYCKSLFNKKSYVRDKDFFFYGIKDLSSFKKELQHPDSLLVMGFSYCEKPHECPSKRFTPDCIHDPEHPVCRQCFIGKAINALPEKRSIALIIPTIHYIAKNMFEIREANPGKRVLFIITACEMTLEMFGDWGNMAALQGIGVRLDGRICNTMKAFELSENGIKPGLTVVVKETEQRILDLLEHFSLVN